MERKSTTKRSFGKSGRGEERKPFNRDGDAPRDGRRSSGIRAPRFSIPKGTEINYKNIAFLQKCLTERGKIFSRRMTSATAKEQRMLAEAVKIARFLGLLPVGSSKRK